ncbi:sigma-70 family RNA polymerase sigma factor [candidate division KSB1 bacterium]|nr:sigma-70 family RNA polymerase sigma factor [candidate division KSB1 bacterium]
MQPTDDELMQRVANGESDAFSLLVERYKYELYQFVLQRVHNREIASDLSQDVFVKIFQAAGQYSPEGKFRSWLYRIAQNICVDEYRQRCRASILPLIQIDGSEAERKQQSIGPSDNLEGDPAYGLELKELNGYIQQALQRLPEPQRTAFILCQTRGLTYQEIARIQGCPLGTVKSRVHVALHKIKEYLKECELL